MSLNKSYIEPEIVEQIKSAAKLIEVIENFVPLKKQGSSYIGECHVCNNAKGLNVVNSSSKKLYKCFKCDDGGSSAIQYLMGQQKKTYTEALEFIANIYNIDIQKPAPIKKRRKKVSKSSFRDQQLKSSGISKKDQTFTIKKGDKEWPDNNRYQKGTITKSWDIDPTGDDMILHYRDLSGNPETYYSGKKKRNFFRVRYKNPELHTDKKGKPMKYASPYGSGSHMWYPEAVIKHFNAGGKVDSLFIPEGEKKADLLCSLGLFAAGMMGIHNLDFDEMPHEFEMLIDKFDIKNVVFLLDEDYRDLSIKENRSIDSRPKTFASAVKKFLNYFNAFNKQGKNIRIFFGSHISDKKYKGIDDFIVANKGKKEDLVEEMSKLLISHKQISNNFEFYDITSYSDVKVDKHWNLHSPVKFIEEHKEILKTLKEFRIGKIKKKYNEDTDEFELAQELMPSEQFWIEVRDPDTGEFKKLKFHYKNIEDFLRNRGIGLYNVGDLDYWFIHIQDNIVKKIDPRYIQMFTLEFVKNLEIWSADMIYNFLKAGISQYLGPQQASYLISLNPNFRKPEKDSQVIAFSNGFAQVTANDVIFKKTTTYHFWEDKVHEHKFEILPDPIFDLKRVGKHWSLNVNKNFLDCEVFQFLYNTSCTYWEKAFELSEDKQGKKFYKKIKGTNEDLKITKEEEIETLDHFAAKVLAMGYLIHDYFDFSNTKAVICMDLKESEVGASFGGSGKSIFAKFFTDLVNTFKIDATGKNMSEDRFQFEGVDERCDLIFFDDCRNDMDFKSYFNKISDEVQVQRKGLTRVDAGNKKFIFTLNGIIKGDSDSYLRRQYPLGFTDYYNSIRKPNDEFGHQLKKEWDFKQWNYFYNFAMTCLKIYLQYGLKFTIPQDKLKRRRQRETMGETFLDWATVKFHPKGEWINHKLCKEFILDEFLTANPRSSYNTRTMKNKLKVFAEYSGYGFNIQKNGERIMSNGKEFYCISLEGYDDRFSKTVRNRKDLENDFKL